MTKARIDWMQSGKVLQPEDGCELVSITWGKYIKSNGQLANSSTVGAHVAEYRIMKPSNHFAITHYNLNSGNLTTAYYNSSGTFTSGRVGNKQTLISQFATDIIWFTPQVATVRIYGIYNPDQYPDTRNKMANMLTYRYDVAEMKVKPVGETTSQIVWPTQSHYVISSARVEYYAGSNYGGIWALAANGTSSAYAVATVKEMLGQTEVHTYTDVILDAKTILDNGRDNIDGQLKDRFRIETFQNPGHSSPVIGHSVVRGNDWKTTPSPGGSAGMGTDVIFTYQNLVDVTLLVGQHGNVIIDTTYKNDSVLGYNIELSRLEIQNPTGGNRDVTVTGTLNKVHTPVYEWLSNSFSDGNPEPYSENGVDSITVSPSTGVTINGATATFPDNTGASEITYAITGYYQTTNHDTKDLIVYGYDSGYSYSNLTVTASYANIAAGGGTSYPVVNISIKRSDNKTMTGTVSNGETSCLVSGGGASTTVSISYTGDCDAHGKVTAQSRGTTTGNARVVGSATITITKTWKNNGSVTNSASATCTQDSNNVSVVQGDFEVTSVVVKPYVGGDVLPISNGVYQLETALNTDVTVKVFASGHGTTTQYTYSSGIVIGGNNTQMDNEEVTPASISVSVAGGSSVTVDNGVFTADNRHLLTDKTYNISAIYELTPASCSMKQWRDAKVNKEAEITVSLTEVANTNTLWAGGGEVQIKGIAYQQSGMFWESDNADVEGEMSEPVYILNQLAINANGSAYTVTQQSVTSTYKIYRVQHRDMETNETTDTLSVTASVGTQFTNPLTYSVLNQEEPNNWFRENAGITWGDYTPRAKTYEIYFSVDRYTSDEDRAPSRSNSTIYTDYSVLARHSMYYYRTGVESYNTYIPYTSWSQAHNDDNHRRLSSTDTLSVTEWGSFIEWAQDTPSVSRPSADTWLTINAASNTGGTLIFAQQTSGGTRRGTTVTAMNANDPSANRPTISVGVFQNLYQDLAISDNSHNFPWQNPQTFAVTITSQNVPWQFSLTGYDTSWCTFTISIGGQPEQAISTDTVYGNNNASTYATLYIRATTNMERTIRISGIDVVPLALTDVLSTLRIRLTQDPYDGSLPND